MTTVDIDGTPTGTWDSKAALVENKKDELSKDQWKLIRDHVHMNVREISKIMKELETMKGQMTKLQSGAVELEQTTTSRLDKEFGAIKKDLEEEKSHRTAKTTLLERQVTALSDRITARDAADETARQKMELNIATVKKEHLERSDVLTGRITATEGALETRIPAALAEMKTANQKLQLHMNEQMDALKELQETHKMALTDAVSLEKRRRDEAIQELNDKFQRLLQEEKVVRETRVKTLEETLEARIEAEKNERAAALRGVTESIQQERAKREQAVKSIEDMIEAALTEERSMRDSAHGELQTALNREKSARESHRAGLHTLLEEERAAREAHIKDLHDKHAAAKDGHQHLEKELQKERNQRDGALADLKRALDGNHDHVRGLLDKESTARAAHLDDKIGEERARREQTLKDMFDKCRAEGDAVLQSKLDNEVSMRTAAMGALRDMIEAETINRGKDVDEVREMIGAERKTRLDHHKDFDEQLRKHREEFDDHRDSIHDRINEEQTKREMHHDAHKEHLRSLLEAEGSARSAHHATLAEQVQELRSMLEGEVETRSTSTAAMQKSIDALEEAFGGSDTAGMASRGKPDVMSRNNRGGSNAVTTKRVLVPLRTQLDELEAKILQEVSLESEAREAHGSEIKSLVASGTKALDEVHDRLKRELEAFKTDHGELKKLLDSERDERSAHLDSHRKERDLLHSALQDRLDNLHGRHENQAKAHDQFQEEVHQIIKGEIENLRQSVSAETSSIDANAKALRSRLDGLQDETSKALAKEKASREATSKDLGEAMSRRLEYIEAILENTDDTRSEVVSIIKSPVSLSFASDKTSNVGKRVITVQQRLEVLERRLRDEISREAACREADASNFGELLKEQTKLREEQHASVKNQIDKERSVRSTTLKEESEQLGKEIEALRSANSKSFQEVENREKANALALEKEVSVLKSDIDEERSQRIAADKAGERSHAVLAERVTTEEANNETHRQRFDLALTGQKKDVKERHDLVLERIAHLENHVGEALPAALTEMRDADNKMQQHIKDHMDAVKSMQDAAHSSLTDLVALERSTREEAIRDLHGQMGNRFTEEKQHRDSREAFLQEHFNSRLGEEKEERDAGHRSLSHTLSTEKTKRDDQLAALKDESMAAIQDHRSDSDAKHAETKALIFREREAREAHGSAAKALHEDTKKNHDTAIADLKAQLDASRNELKAAQEKDNAALAAQGKENHTVLHDRLVALKNGMEEELRKRDAHLSNLNQGLNDEKQSRDALIAKHRDEHTNSLVETVKQLRQEHVNGLKRIESASQADAAGSKELLQDASRRLEYIEAVLGEGYFSDKQMKKLVTIRQQIDSLESTLRDELVRETQARESVSAGLRAQLSEEVQAREGLEGCVKESFIKERLEHEKKISEAFASFKSLMIHHFDSI